MQYLVSVIEDKSNPGSTDRRVAISAFNERLMAEGYWVFAGGLADTDAATVIDNRASSRCSATGLSWSRRSTSPASGCGRLPIWMSHSSSPPRRRSLRSEDRGAAVPVNAVEEAMTRAHYDEWARVVAALARRFGDLGIAEEAAAEAFATAVERAADTCESQNRWRADGVPPRSV